MRILIAEDDPAIADVVTRALEASNYIVDLTVNGEDACHKVFTETPAAMVLDLGLPLLDGLTLLRRMRTARLPTAVLILTARGAWVERVAGIDAGADDYLTKPFHADELLARLAAIMRRSVGYDTPVLRAGRIELDTRRLTVSVDGIPATVSPMEFRLLRYLMHHGRRVVSRQELHEHLYADDCEPDSNAIEVLIGRIRRKLGVQLVQTRRGFGYWVETD
ncbi:response regulator transcription factor [Alsobacter sp. R-9]